jgi:hypothetical protein
MVLDNDFVLDLKTLSRALKMMMGLQSKPRLKIFYKKSAHALKKAINNLYANKLVCGDDEEYKKKKKREKSLSNKEIKLLKKVSEELKLISDNESDLEKSITLGMYSDTLKLCLKVLDRI